MDLIEKKTNLKILASKVFFKSDGLEEVVRLIDNNKIYTVREKSEIKLEEAEEKVLETVYNGDCDFVLFDHYKRCRNFDSAVTQYEEDK